MYSAKEARRLTFENCDKGNFIVNLKNRIKEAVSLKKINIEYKYLKKPMPGEIAYVKSLGYKMSHNIDEATVYVSWGLESNQTEILGEEDE